MARLKNAYDALRRIESARARRWASRAEHWRGIGDDAGADRAESYAAECRADAQGFRRDAIDRDRELRVCYPDAYRRAQVEVRLLNRRPGDLR